ncbi:MAG: competence/damage-inducible protein A [Omnitrophica bacterium]|nr:competence/damage-inducible protein A [Candidatus Omnitrophota bacterium]
MQAEIVCIGTELLLGRIVNSNAAYLSKKLASLGIDVFHHTTVGDNHTRLFTVLKRAMHRSDIVIATGGLGPTVDDITLEIVAQVIERNLSLNPVVLKDIKEHFHKRHIPMPKANLRQALIPKGAKVLKNEVGTAPGLIIPFDKKVLIALPGVPKEMKPMMKHDVIVYLAKHFAGNWVIVSRSVKTTGLAESQVNQKVKDILKIKPPVTVGIYTHTDSVDLNITAKAKNKRQAQKLIAPVERKICSRLKEHIYGKDGETLEEVVAQGLRKGKKTLAVAESCTGGLIAKRLTNISGSSKYFPLGLVAYSNQAKQTLLSISPETLKKYGAVSKEVARQMALNIRQLAKTNLGLGITGIAGPTGATKDKPLGLVYIALATPHKIFSQEFHFHGDRSSVRQRASQAALDILRQHL